MKEKALIISLLFIFSLALQAQKEMSLSQCQQLALEHNHQLKMSEKQAEAAGYMEKSAFTKFLPNFSAEAAFFRLNKPVSLTVPEQYLPIADYEGNIVYLTGPSGDPILGPDGNPVVKNWAYMPEQNLELGEKEAYIATATMSQPIYNGGKIRETYKMAGYARKIAHSKKEMTQSEVLYETAKHYWKVISVKEKVKLVENYRKQVEKLIKDLKNYREEGIITSNELLKAKVKRNEIDFKLTKAKNGLNLAKMALNQMVGFPLDSNLQLKDSLNNLQLENENKNYRAKAISNRPEVNMLQQKVNMAKSGVELSKARFMPDIALTANYYALQPNPFNNFKNEYGHDWMVGMVCKVPIFHWGDKMHTLNAARLQKEASELELKETREKIQLQVQQQIYKVREATKQVELTNSSLNQAKENLEMTKNNFEEGLVKTTDVLEAQAMWQKAYANKIDALTQLKMSKLALQKAIGKLEMKQ